jgi:class 3 adenylate cyclase
MVALKESHTPTLKMTIHPKTDSRSPSSPAGLILISTNFPKDHTMADIPTGTLTFLFTDIEGSTQLWEKHPDAMKLALARHDSILRQAIETHHGKVFKTVGDAFYAVFSGVPEAFIRE